MSKDVICVVYLGFSVKLLNIFFHEELPFFCDIDHK